MQCLWWLNTLWGATAKFIFRQYFLRSVLGQTAKFKDHQYFQLYDIYTVAEKGHSIIPIWILHVFTTCSPKLSRSSYFSQASLSLLSSPIVKLCSFWKGTGHCSCSLQSENIPYRPHAACGCVCVKLQSKQTYRIRMYGYTAGQLQKTPLNSLLWGSLRLAPIIHTLFAYFMACHPYIL